MRLSEDQVKQGISHPERIVRDAALGYFSDSSSADPGVMPLAVGAIERFGWDGAFSKLKPLASLAQTDDTLLWAIDQLNRMGRPKAHEDAERCDNLSSMIAKADIGLLMRHEERILGLEWMDGASRDAMADRLRLSALDTASCWDELEQFCDGNKRRIGINQVDLPRAERVAEAIARDEASAERVLSVLSQKIDDSGDDPTIWMEGLAVQMSGLMRLESAAPMLIAKLAADRSYDVNDRCVQALAKIGTDATIDAICKGFAAAPKHYRLYVAGTMERIRTDHSVMKCQELLAQEKDARIRTSLVAAILANFCAEGIEPARQITLSGKDEVRPALVAVATLMAVPFPELEKFRRVEVDYEAAMKLRNEWIAGGEIPEPQPKRPPIAGLTPPTPPAPIVGKRVVGRNDPCPCKSGKKYKKCCGRNE